MNRTQETIRSEGSARTRLLLVGVVTVTALTSVACASSDPSGNVARGPATGEAVRIAMDDRRFSPEVLELPAGEEVTVEVRNEDDSAHDFAVEALDVNTGILESGHVATATFTVPEQPTEFECTLHDGMTGRIEPT